MSAEHDLRRAWRDLLAGPPGGELVGEPEDVRRAVERLRRAWREMPIPAPPLSPARAAAARARPWLPAAAAMLLLALAVALVVSRHPRAPNRTAARAELDPRRPRVLVATRDRVEMRAGSVHLVLVRPDPAKEKTHPFTERTR